MTPSDHPGWGGYRPGAGRKPARARDDDDEEPYSITRAIAAALKRGGQPDGLEGELHQELDQQNRGCNLIAHLRGLGVGAHLVVPFEAFRRDVSVSGGAVLFGKAIREEAGICDHAAVVEAGAQVITGLKENVGIPHVSALPTAEWVPEVGAITDSDPVLTSSIASPKRLACVVELSKQLSIQSSRGADELVTRTISRALNAMIDWSSLYGSGANNQPRGVLSTPGVGVMPIGAAEWWEHLARMRRRVLESDAEPDSFAYVTSPNVEEILTFTSTSPSGGLPIVNALRHPLVVSNEIDDNRMFVGLWQYLALLFWGASAVDLIVDEFSLAHAGRLRIIAAVFADTICRFPAAFATTEEIAPASPREGPLKGPPHEPASGPKEEPIQSWSEAPKEPERASTNKRASKP